MEVIVLTSFCPDNQDYLDAMRERMRRQMLEEADKQFPGQMKTLSPVSFHAEKDGWGNVKITAQMQVALVERMQVRMIEPPEPSYRAHTTQHQEETCPYCRARLQLDWRGCCSACGAPPGEKKKEWTVTPQAKYQVIPKTVIDGPLREEIAKKMSEDLRKSMFGSFLLGGS